MAKDLRYFLEQLQKAMPEEFVRVRREVDPRYELSAVMHKMQAERLHPVVFFERVKGHTMPVVANLWASRKLVACAMETTVEQVVPRLVGGETGRIPTRMVGSGPVQEVVLTGDQVDLGRLPIVTHCEEDSGAYICPGMLIVRDPDTGVRNGGMYRHMVHAPRLLGASLGPPSHAAHLLRKAEARGEDLEGVIALGHHPAMGIASQHSGSLEVDELEVMGGLLGEPVEMVPCQTVALEVPAFTEIAIEGRLKAGVRREDGPFGEFTWYYGGPRANAVFEVTAITHRHDAIFHDLYNVGHEHVNLMCTGLEPNAFQFIRAVVPQARAVHMPLGGVATVIYVQIRKEYDGLGKNAALAALASHAFIETAIIVDEDVNIYNDEEVMWAVATRCDPERDYFFVPEGHVCRLDPASHSFTQSSQGGLKSKLGIDATKPVEAPFPKRAEPPRALWQAIRLEEYL